MPIKKKILIADDQSVDRLIIKDIVELNFPDYSVIECSNGEETIKTVSEEIPDIILLDWIMPIMDGIQILKILRNAEKTRDIPVIMITTLSDSESFKTAYNYGVTDFISKPVNPDELYCRIRSALLLNQTLLKLKEQNTILTELTLSLEKNQKELELLSLVASHTTNSVVIIDKDGTLEWANAGFENFYKLSLDVFIGKFGKTIFDVSRNSSIQQCVHDCFNYNKAVTYVAFWEFPDQTKKWIQTTLTPVMSKDGQIHKLIAIETDISKLKEYENELIQQKENLQTLNDNLHNAFQIIEKKNKENQ